VLRYFQSVPDFRDNQTGSTRQTEFQRRLGAGSPSIDFTRPADDANRSRFPRSEIRRHTKLKATLNQTADVLTIAARGPGFALNQTLYLDGRNDPTYLQILGATSGNTKTVWSKDYKQLVETHHIRTKQGRDGELTIKRNLTDHGKAVVVVMILKLEEEPTPTSARQIWRKQA
jgi:hypothetical protein